MKVLVRMIARTEKSIEAVQSGSLAARFKGDSTKVGILDSESREFDFMLERLTALRAGIDWIPVVQFDADELREAEWLEVRPTSVARLSEQTESRNIYFARLAPRFEVLPGIPVFAPRGILMDKHLPAANSLQLMGEWGAEYVAGKVAAEALSREFGVELVPAYDAASGWYSESCFQIRTEAFAPPCRPNGYFEVRSDDAMVGGARIGAICYGERLPEGPAMRRTAEPWAGWRLPGWIVRQEVRHLMQDAGISGWGFEPTLIEGTELWSLQLSKLNELYRRMDACPGHHSHLGWRPPRADATPPDPKQTPRVARNHR